MINKFNNYVEVREWLENYIPLVYGKEELGLARIENLLRLLGNPERKFKSIHVAGTSGKGSVAYNTAKLLSSQFTVYGSQSKIGLHISPHLVDIRERMQIIGGIGESEDRGNRRIGRSEESENRKIGEDGLMPMGKFIKLFNEIKPVVEKIQKEKPELTPSYFEILVAVSFKYFAEEKVDWAVVEVGLGGRLDATNVLMPEVSVITNIGLDHTEILGDTVEKIAKEKAGIIKTKVAKVSKGTKVSKVGVPVVTAAKGKALEVIRRVAKEKGAKVVLVSGSKYLVSGKEKKQKNAQNFNLEIAKKAVEVALSLRGAERRGNLKRDRHGHQDELAMTMTGLPGRFEEIEPGVILDGAHNPDKIKALLEFVNSRLQLPNYKNENILRANARSSHSVRTIRELVVLAGARTIKDVVLVLAFKQGKDWKQMVDLLIKNLPVVQVIATEFNAVTDTGKFGAVSGKEIKDYLDTKFKILNTKYFPNSQAAVFEAFQSTVNSHPFDELRMTLSKPKGQLLASLRGRSGSTVIITGSLYLVGEVRTMWELPEF